MYQSIETTRGYEISTDEPMPLNVGGALGPKIVSTPFGLSIQSKDRRTKAEIKIVVDLDRAEFQDAFAIRRRAAHAAVGVGRRTGAAISGNIIAGALTQQITQTGLPTLFWNLSFSRLEVFEGKDRRAHGGITLRCETVYDQPEIARADIDLVASGFQALAEGLHSAIDLSANSIIFYGR